MDVVQLTGWIGSFMLAMCGVPLLIASVRNPAVAKQLSLLFLHLWFWGEVLVLWYAVALGKDLLPVVFNTGFNIVCILGIFWIRRSK